MKALHFANASYWKPPTLVRSSILTLIGFLELHDLLSHVELMQRLQLLGQFGDVIGEQLAEELTTEMDQIIELESHNRPAGLQLLIDEKRHHFGRQ